MKDIFLLDLDDTLTDFPRAEEKNFYETLASVGVRATGEVYERFHRINNDLWRQLEAGEIKREELNIRRFAMLFEEFGIGADPAEAAAFYVNNFENICFPFDGAAEFVRELSARGRVYIVSNGSKNKQRAHIKRAGIEGYLCGAFISEEVGFDKPMYGFAHHVETHIEGFRRDRAVWIGDSLTSDMVCAKSVGIDFILYLPRTMSVSYEGRFARSYGEILRLLDTM